MANIPGRSGRRRRVLNEEVLSASASHLALRAAEDHSAVASAHRYGDAAAIENHPQISDFIPRRHRTIAMLLVIGLVATGAVGAFHQLAAPLAAATGTIRHPSLDASAGNSLAAWMGSVLLFMGCLMCALIYSIRRHRIDDYRGRYRVWRWAALALFLMSANNVAQLHTLIAEVLSHYAGWSALRDGAVWWIILAGVPLAWIGARIILEMRESVAATLLFLLSACTYATATVSFLGWLPGIEAAWEPLLTGAAALLGHWLSLTAVVSYARHVVLDAQGLIQRRTSTSRSNKRRASVGVGVDSKSPAVDEESLRQPPTTLRVHSPPTSAVRPTISITPAKSQAEPGEWVDGSRRERDRYDDDYDREDDAQGGDHKLSKAERKQLRKLKARNRAA